MLLYTPATRRLWRRCARVGTPIRAHSTPSSRQEVQFRTATWILPKGRSRSCGRKDAAATCKPTASTPGHTKCRRGSPSFALLLRAISIACSRAGRSAAKDRGVARAITSPRRWSKAITRDAAVKTRSIGGMVIYRPKAAVAKAKAGRGRIAPGDHPSSWRSSGGLPPTKRTRGRIGQPRHVRHVGPPSGLRGLDLRRST